MMATIKQEVAAVLAATGKTDVHPLVIEKLEELAFVMWANSVNRRLLVSRNQREGAYQGKTRWTFDTRTGMHGWNENDNRHRRGAGAGLKHRGYATGCGYE